MAERLGLRSILSILVVVSVIAGGLGFSPVFAAADDPVPDCSYVVNAGDVTLSWTEVAGIDKYVAERVLDGGAWTWTGAPAAGTSSFVDNLPGGGQSIDGYRMFTKTNGVLSAPTVCTDGAGGGGANDEVPNDLFATTDGSATVELIWDEIDAAAIVGYEVFRNGTSLGTTADESFSDTPGGNGPFTYEVASYDGNGTLSEFSEAIEVRVGTTGTCSATMTQNGIAVVIWENAPQGAIALHDATADGYLPLKWFSPDLNVVGTFDWNTDWGASDPDYRVVAYRPDGTISSQPCGVVAGTTQRYQQLAALGAPLLSDGRIGGESGNSPLVEVSLPIVNSNVGTTSATASPMCSDGGIVYNFFPNPGPEYNNQWIELVVPDGIGVTIDVINHKDVTDPGNWSGKYRAYKLDGNGNIVGGLQGDGSIIAPYWWDQVGAGDQYQVNDFKLFTNNEGQTQLYGLNLENLGGVSLSQASDPGSSFRIEDIKFVNSNDELIAEPCAKSDELKCHISGGNLFVAEPFTDQNGDTVDRGCYVHGSCMASDGYAWGIRGIAGLAEWACENDDLLEAALLASTVTATSFGLIIIGGPAGAGAAIGLVSSMWTCDQSDNQWWAPATAFDDLDGTCVATETALGGVFGFVGGAAGVGGRFIPAVAFTCAFGAVENGTGYIVHALIDGNITEASVTQGLTEAGIGCATAGVATGAGGLVGRITGRAPIETPSTRNAEPPNAPRHPHLVEAEEAPDLADFLGTNKRKGNYGEMVTDADLKASGWEVVHVEVVDSLDAPIRRGIDHIYRRPDGPGYEYIVVESKYGSSRLGSATGVDGDRIRQMDSDWIETRILNAVGGDEDLFDEILLSYKPVLAEIDRDTGAVTYFELDDAASKIGSWTP